MPSLRLIPCACVLLLAAADAYAEAMLYAANGPRLTAYRADPAATLTELSHVTLPDNVQEAWPHPSRRYLYVAWSNNSPGAAGHHGVTAFRVDPSTGALEPHGAAIPVPARSVFLTVDIPGRHLIVAYNNPSKATVHRIAADGTLGAEVAQSSGLDFGVYAHQVRVHPSNRMVVVVARGNGPEGAKAEDPGALKVYGFREGMLANRASIAPGGGFGFQPRHIDFHPSRPFAYLTVERQNKLHVYRVVNGPSLSAAPVFTAETLADPSRLSGQATSAIHFHPAGRFLYLGNRGGAGGENSIAVYAVNPETGEPKLIQSAATGGVHPRTFSIHPSGRMLVVANLQRAGEVQPCLSVFRIGSDGKLELARKYDQPAAASATLFWTGFVELP